MCCYACDIGLMVNDSDINMMSVFCLSQLTENEKSHQYLIKTLNPVLKLETQTMIDIRDLGSTSHHENASSHHSGKVYGLFNRFNMLMDTYDPKDLNGHSNQQDYF